MTDQPVNPATARRRARTVPDREQLPDDAYPQGKLLVDVLKAERAARVDERDRAQARLDEIDRILADLEGEG